jgi:competence protein ComGF
MGNHRSKTANIRGFCLAHNTLLRLTELKYSLPIVQMFLFMLVTPVERPLALNQPRQSNLFLAYINSVKLY